MRRVLTAAAVVLLLFVAAAGWLVGTESGLQWGWERAREAVPGRLAAASVEGRLAGVVRVRELQYEHDAAHLTVANLRFDWQATRLLLLTFALGDLDADGVRVVLKARADDQPPPPSEGGPFQGIALPLTVALQRAALSDLQLLGVGESPLSVDEVTAEGVFLRHDHLAMDAVRVQAPQGGILLQGTLGTRPRAPVDLAVRWSANLPAREVGGRLHLQGVLEAFRAELLLGGEDEPIHGLFQADVQWLTQPLVWRFEGHLEVSHPQAIDPALRPLSVAAQLSGQGGTAELRLDGEATLRDPEFGPWRGEFALHREGARWRLPKLHVAALKGSSELVAEAEWRQGEGLLDMGELALKARWRDLAWPPAGGEMIVMSPEGELTVDGAPAAYQLQLSAAVVGVAFPPSRWAVSGEGDLGGLRIDRLRGEGLEGTWSGDAQVAWRPAVSWQAQLGVKGLNPGAAWPEWPGSVSATLSTRGRVEDSRPQLEATLEVLRGQLRGYPLAGNAHFALEGESYRLERLRLASGSAELAASGQLDERWNARWRLQAPRLGELWPELQGSLSSSGRISGPRPAPRLQASLSGGQLVYGEQRVGSVEAQADLDLAGRAPWSLDLRASGVEAAGQRLERLMVAGEGSAPDHTLVVRARRGEDHLQLRAHGQYGQGQWQGRLESGTLSLAPVGQWVQERPAGVLLSGSRRLLEPFCWRSDDARLCLGGDYTPAAGWQANAALERFPLERIAPLVGRPELRLSGWVDGEMTLSYREFLHALKAELRLERGTMRYLLGEEVLETRFRTARLSARGDMDGLGGELELSLVDGGRATLQARLPGWVPGLELPAAQPVRGRVEAHLEQLAWVGVFVPELVQPRGRLEADLGVSGTLAEPLFDGRVALAEGAVSIPRAGIDLQGLALEARTAEGTTIVLRGRARSGPGALRLEGSVAAESPAEWQLRMSITGENFEAARLPQAHLFATPDLNLLVRPGRIELGGSVLIPRAQINLPELPTTVEASPDVVIVDQPVEDPVISRWAIHTDIEVRFGDEVRLQGYGFTGRLVGRLTIIERPQVPTAARGEVRVVQGRYKAYGQELSIEEGRLLFAGGAVGNPGLDIRAVRRVEEVTVGVSVTGRLRDPVLRLFSDPPMDDINALAYLVLGRPLNTATQAEGGELYQAALSLGLAGGGRIARQIGAQFGIEDVAIETGDTPEQASLVLGTYLSPRLYLQYAVGLWETANVLRIRYRLGQRWTLEAESGAQTGADLLFTIER